jgi:hypothetical protein
VLGIVHKLLPCVKEEFDWKGLWPNAIYVALRIVLELFPYVEEKLVRMFDCRSAKQCDIRGCTQRGV